MEKPENYSSTALLEALGVNQHHDAITGTSKQHVAEDYAMRLYAGYEDCLHVISSGLSKLASSMLDFYFTCTKERI